MFDKLKEILQRLFGKKTVLTNDEIAAHNKYTSNYEDISDINFTSIFANKLASLTVTESNVNVVGSGDSERRATLLDNLINSVWTKANKITAQTFGTGGVVLLPYSVSGKIYTDVVPQNRFFINKMQGEDILEATILADVIVRDNQTYCRYTDYSLQNNVYIVRNRAVRNGNPCPLDILTEWENIMEEIRIANVDKILIAYLKCPTDNRRTESEYGVPVTFGCEKIIEDIKECLKQIQTEFREKRVRVFADESMFDKNDKLNNSIFKKFIVGGKIEAGPFLEIFDPSIRDSAYYNRLSNLFELLEKSVGTAKGILTEPATQGATATEIKRSIYDTFALVENMRKNWEAAIFDLVYAYDVFADFYSLAPQSEYTIRFDWSYAMIESSQETYQQLADGVAAGVVKKAELRQYIKPNESLEEAQIAIDDIRSKEPNLRDLIGAE